LQKRLSMLRTSRAVPLELLFLAVPRETTRPCVEKGHRRKVDLQALVTEIVVTPWASSTTVDEINALVDINGYEIPVHPSELTRYRGLLPYSPVAVHP
jgi:hypothetical protein